MQIVKNISLKNLTTFKVGGFVRYYAEIRKTEDLLKACEFARAKKLPLMALGGGSNTYFSDKGYKGLILGIKIKGIEVVDNKKSTVELSVGAGENWDRFVLYTLKRGYYGLENLSGVPGLVGASPIQNIGAYGTEVGGYIKEVECFDIKLKKFVVLSNTKCTFSYRHSFFKTKFGKNKIITRVTFSLPKKPNLNISYKDLAHYFSGRNAKEVSVMDIRKAVIRIRKKKFPDLKKYGTAGSFFKNPIITQNKLQTLRIKWPEMPFYLTRDGFVKLPIAWMLDNILKVKGTYIKNVGSFEKQPLVLVTNGNATSKEIDSFAKKIEKNFFQITKIKIVREVICVK